MAFDLWDYATAKTPAERGIALALFTADVGALLLDCTDGGAGVGVLALAGTRATIKAGRTGAKLASAARHAGNAALHAGNEGRKQQGSTSDSKVDAGGGNSGSSTTGTGDAGTTSESAQKTQQKSQSEAGAAMKRGRQSEKRVLDDLGETKNTTKHSTSHGNTIPDFENTKRVGEIKDTKKVADTRQMKAQREVAEQSGRQHALVTGKNTNVTKPMEQSSTRIERRTDLGPKDQE